MPIDLAVNKPLPTHPQYAEQSQARDFWRRSDRARWDYATGSDAQGRAILPKHEREPGDRYDRRRWQAIVRRYAKPILDRYNDFVARGEVVRKDGSAPYKLLIEDADGAGTPLSELMTSSRRRAQTDGVAYVLVDANDPQTYATAAQESAAGKRGILRQIDANDVVFWREWQGSVVEALILCVDRAGVTFAWHVDEQFTQRIDLKKHKGGSEWLVAEVQESIPHSYGGCPLVRLWPDYGTGECAGDDSQCAPLAEGQKRICNIDSWLFEELQGCTFTTTVLLGVSADSVKDMTVGPGQALCLPNAGGSNPSISKIGADVTQAQSIRDSLNHEIKELYRVAGLASGNPTENAQPESGVAKAFAFNEIEAKCAALSTSTEKTENRCALLLSKGFGWAYPGDADYPDTFSAPDLASELAIAIQMQTAGMPNVLQKAQVLRVASTGFNLTGEEKAELAETLEAAPIKSQMVEQSDTGMPGAPRVPASDPKQVAVDKAVASGAQVSSTALNGAQVTSLADVISKVSLGQMPAVAAELLLVEAFPAMDPGSIKRMVAASAAFTPEPLASDAPRKFQPPA